MARFPVSIRLALALCLPIAGPAAALAPLQEAAGYALYRTAAPVAPVWQPSPDEAACIQGQPLPAPAASQAGTARATLLFKERYFVKFFEGGKLQRLIALQEDLPRAVVLESGVWRPEALLRQINDPSLLAADGAGRFLLQAPLLIRPGATLVVDGGRELRLSQDRGAFLLNVGRLQVQRGSIVGWDGARRRPAVATASGRFRPFVLGWGGSVTTIDEGRLEALGFAEHLSEGLGLAAGPVGLKDIAPTAPPEAWINRSLVRDLHFGLRVRAASRVRVCASRFERAALHGLQVEGGAAEVMIAGNVVSGSRGENGITINKGNRRTRVVANRVEANQRDGIAVEDAAGAWVAGNVIGGNQGNGLTIGASTEVVAVDNDLVGNGRHGALIRSSRAVQLSGGRIRRNGGVGVYAYLAPTAPVPPGSYPISVSRTQLEDNRGGALGLEQPHTLTLWRLALIDTSKVHRPLFRGDLNAHEANVLRELMLRDQAVLLAPTAPRGRAPGGEAN